MCVVIMFLINWKSSLITFIVILGLYLIVVYRKPGECNAVIKHCIDAKALITKIAKMVITSEMSTPFPQQFTNIFVKNFRKYKR